MVKRSFATKTFYRPMAEEAHAANNYFFATFANALNLVAFVNSSVISPTDRLSWILDLKPYSWRDDLVDNFKVSPGSNKSSQLRQTSADQMKTCLDCITDHFFDGLELRDQFCGENSTNYERLKSELNECIVCIRELLDTHPRNKEPSSPIEDILSGAALALFPGPDKDKAKRISEIDEIVQNLLTHLLREDELKISEFLRSNLFRLVKRLSGPVLAPIIYNNTVFGPYHIVRKGRGAITSDTNDSEIIVRDLLWLRPTKTKADADGITTVSRMFPTDPLGYYVSTMDEQVYEVTHVSVRGDYTLIDAVAFLDGNQTKSLCLYTPCMPMHGVNDFAYGSLVGMLRNSKRTGSWSTLVMRPQINDQDLLQFHFTFSFFADCLSSSVYRDKTEDYDPNIDELYWVFALKGLCGVLYSKNWMEDANSANPEAAADFGIDGRDLIRSRDVFKNCFQYSGKHLETMRRFAEGYLRDHELSESIPAEQQAKMIDILEDAFTLAEHTAITPDSLENTDIAISRFAGPISDVSIPYRWHREAYGDEQ